jgi:hypothetical protein
MAASHLRQLRVQRKFWYRHAYARGTALRTTLDQPAYNPEVGRNS